ncbi:unnamed protein product [Callosobruchus maculatus]|uniref:Uncharacterized protein n=1 Tax=Callosobruchus maculatus TaxID=64391 RepID=A0A653DWB0_CALMS|nr:unnamed protein product [Callosobruchus maculatus]
MSKANKYLNLARRSLYTIFSRDKFEFWFESVSLCSFIFKLKQVSSEVCGERGDDPLPHPGSARGEGVPERRRVGSKARLNRAQGLRRREKEKVPADMNSRRHTDNFTPSQKSPIPLNRYDDFDDLAVPAKPRPRTAISS